MAVELISLNPNQHVITFIPKLSAELPFFNLTNYKRNSSKPIKFDGIDNEGNPIHWEVFPNSSKEIGDPGVEAHRVWYLLIKPAIDETRQITGKIPQIIPLGRVRECLRKIGWSAGGRQERELIKNLTQISFAGCIADLWIPTKEVDEAGKPKYVQVKGRFSRMSVYAIGEHHLTEEELKNTVFDYDPEDIIYVKLDPLEAMMQEAQDQRVYDNEYLFSVNPAGRRWYELLAPKIFGTVKNKALFCEIRYSWYTKHHHTLKRYNELKRVKFQMNRIVEDHLESHYISKVEYRAIKEPDKELDFIIRYYPGEGAKESIARIQGHLYRKRNKKELAPETPAESVAPRIDKTQAEQGSVPEAPSTVDVAMSLLTMHHAENEQLVTQLITKFGVVAGKAFELVKTNREAVALQLQVFPHRNLNPENPAGWIIKAIQTNFSAPESYRAAKEQEAAQEKLREREALIAACSYCQELKGFVYTEREGVKAVRKCTHNPAIEGTQKLQTNH